VIHPTAEIEVGAIIGAGTRIWHHCHVRTGAMIGAECILGYGVYVDAGVSIGNRCKLQNRVSVYRGVTIHDGVFVGPHVSFTNDRHPRAVSPDGHPLTDADWQALPTLVQEGASIGAGAVILPGLTIGRWAMVAAGSLVSRDVPDHGLVAGNPARLTGYVCSCGRTLVQHGESLYCGHCDRTYDFPPIGEPEGT
jgi:acetyltransferase-like isoleucine patch superfamily enzyme